ncbi:hypothetical protein GGR51DRAFT_545794 [Nemania sp. FL0031]|nr:hypothetical protein GGR51DRAFT_545794 [Nemania sp. FL0031]
MTRERQKYDAVELLYLASPYYVRATRHAIRYYNGDDVLASKNISTAFLAPIFYPTKKAPKGKPKPSLNPETTSPFLCQDDLKEATPFPALLYGPGGPDPPTEGSTILLSELASYDYAVVGLDHPFEQPFLQFPTGTAVYGIGFDGNIIDVVGAIYNTRPVGNAAVLQQFPDLVCILNAPFNADLFGLFGYSFGGGATLGTMLDEEGKFNLAAALNIYDPFWGRVIGNSSDQTGLYFRKILVNGLLHHDFSYAAFWKTVETGVSLSVGDIDGLQRINITNTLVRKFFDHTLLGRQEGLLYQPSAGWLELTYLNRNGLKVTA